MAWVYPVASTNFEEYLLIEVAAGSAAGIDALQRQGTTSQYNLVVWQGGSSTAVQGGTITNNQWVHLAMVRESATVLKAYVDGALAMTVTSPSVSGRSAAGLMGFGDVHGGIPFAGRVYAAKAWDTALLAGQVEDEMYLVRPRYLFGVWGWWPCFPGINERYLDYSGNGRHWTESGSLSDEDPPPVSWGAEALAVVTPSLSGVVATPRRRTLMGVGT